MKILDDNDRGQVRVEGNEVLATSKIPDAAKFRVRAPRVPAESGGGGAFSFDVLDTDGKWKETQLITGGMNGQQGGEGKLIVLMKGGVIDDAHQKTIIQWDDEQVEILVPLSAPNLQTNGNELRAPGGIFWFVIQESDGNLVAYRNRVPFDYSTGVPYFSSGPAPSL